MRKFLTSVPLVAVLAACATPGTRTAVGAGGGAAVGAGVGAIAGGWKGAAIGAAIGGVAGGAAGNYLDKQAQELKQVAENTRRTEDGILVDLKSKLLFSTDSAVLKPEAVEHIAKLGAPRRAAHRHPANLLGQRAFTGSAGGGGAREDSRCEPSAACVRLDGLPRSQISRAPCKVFGLDIRSTRVRVPEWRRGGLRGRCGSGPGRRP